MASALSIALRREDAMRRIEAALEELHVRIDNESLRSPVADPEIRLANTLEAIAGALERAAKKAAKPEPAPEPAPAPKKGGK